jgi:hypothetical protein
VLQKQEAQRDIESLRMRIEEGRLSHAGHRADYTNSFNAAIQFSLEAIRTSALINGGSVVASITFGANIFTDNPQTTLALMYPVFIFAIGAVLAGFASGFAYLSQIFSTNYLLAHDLVWEYPYEIETPRAKRLLRFSYAFQFLSIFSIAFSYGCLLKGIWEAYEIFGG